VSSAASVPVSVGGVCVGGLTVVSRHRDVGRDHSAELLAAAGAVASLVLVGGASSRSRSIEDDLLDHQAVVHQAAGMASVQLGCTPEQALVRMRALAVVRGVELDEVAHEMVARRLRLDQS